jgi:glycosyltransferase involved in cell wall biosynthesis
MKTIVLHDYFANAEGGGRLALNLAQGLQADLAYGFRSDNHTFFKGNNFLLHEIPLGINVPIPLLKQLFVCRSFLHNTAFLNNYRNVFYSGYYSPLAVDNSSKTCRNIYYCHTPPRFIYDQKNFYLSREKCVVRLMLKWFISYLKPLYEEAIGKMDIIIANSENVQKRIKSFLGYKSQVIYPPCDVKSFKWIDNKGYFLSTARLDPLKRVDLIVSAFVKMPDKKLIVTSGGTELPKLKKLAEGCDNVIFTGWVSEDRYRELLGSAVATIYVPYEEDFGLSPVESMAAGKPVLGVAEGGLLESVIPEETGILIEPSGLEEKIVDAVLQMTAKKADGMRKSCERRANMFRAEKFIREIQSTMRKIK